MASVLIWQSELAANDFPPVCAMTGAPAETWRRFTFSKTPPWAFWVGGVILSAALAQRSTGYLPLTRASRRMLRTLTWTFGSFVPLALFFWVIGIIVVSVYPNSTGAGSFMEAMLLLGIGTLFAGLVGVLIGRKSLFPTGKVRDRQPGYYESLIELSNVHPAFVAAVRQRQQTRAQQAHRQ